MKKGLVISAVGLWSVVAWCAPAQGGTINVSASGVFTSADEIATDFGLIGPLVIGDTWNVSLNIDNSVVGANSLPHVLIYASALLSLNVTINGVDQTALFTMPSISNSVALINSGSFDAMSITQAGFTGNGSENYRASFNFRLGDYFSGSTTADMPNPLGQWMTSDFDSLGMTFIHLAADGSSKAIARTLFSNFTVTSGAVVPMPTSAAMGLAGLAMIGVRRRRAL